MGFEGLFLPQHGIRVEPRHDRHVLQVWSICRVVQGAWFGKGHESDERIDDFMGVRPDCPWGPLARRGSVHCPRRSSRSIAVATHCSSGIFGSPSHVCGTSPVETLPCGTWSAGVRSCTGHSRNSLSSQTSRFEVSALLPHSGSACHLIFSCSLPCCPGVASLLCTLPRNHKNCFGCPLSVTPSTPCTSALSDHSGCMVLHSAIVKNGQAWGLGFGCSSGGGGTGAAFGSGLGRFARRAGMSGRGRTGDRVTTPRTGDDTKTERQDRRGRDPAGKATAPHPAEPGTPLETGTPRGHGKKAQARDL